MTKRYYVDWLKQERELVNILIDAIYSKHENNYDSYRNNYRNQLKGINTNQKENIRNEKLTNILRRQGYLYPIAFYKFREGYVCVDGHHRIKAYLTAGYSKIPGIVYKDEQEALKAKRIPYKGMQK